MRIEHIIKLTNTKMQNNKLRKETQYYNNGQLEYKRNFNEEGQRHGKETWYYENGQKQIVRYWENGEQNGTETQYFDNGIIDTVTNYKNDIRDGEFFTYRIDGSLYRKCFYVQSYKHGKEYYYFDNGTIREERNFNNGAEHGEQLYYELFDDNTYFLVSKELYKHGDLITKEYGSHPTLSKGEMFICDNRLYKVSRGTIEKYGVCGCKKSNNFQVVRLKWLLNATHVVPDDDHSKSIHYIDHFSLVEDGVPHKLITIHKDYQITPFLEASLSIEYKTRGERQVKLSKIKNI